MTTTQNTADLNYSIVAELIEYILKSRGITSPTPAQCEEITAHIFRNLEWYRDVLEVR